MTRHVGQGFSPAVSGAAVRRRPCAATRTGFNERGYAMAGLLVALALMAVFMSAALPAWRHAAQREKEAELLWRGRQYDRAIQLFRRKFSVPGPPNLDVLLEQKFLRKKYKDPITGGDFELRPVTPVAEGGSGPGDEAGRRGRRRETRARTELQQRRARGQLIGGVRSRSKDKSILVLNGRERYNEWEFTYVPYTDSRATDVNEAATPGRRRTPRSGTGARPPSNRRGLSPANETPGSQRSVP